MPECVFVLKSTRLRGNKAYSRRLRGEVPRGLWSTTALQSVSDFLVELFFVMPR